MILLRLCEFSHFKLNIKQRSLECNANSKFIQPSGGSACRTALEGLQKPLKKIVYWTHLQPDLLGSLQRIKLFNILKCAPFSWIHIVHNLILEVYTYQPLHKVHVSIHFAVQCRFNSTWYWLMICSYWHNSITQLIVVGCTYWSSVQPHSIGFRSGDCGGHLSTMRSLSFSRKQFEMIWPLWDGVLSCWKQPPEDRSTVIIKEWTWSAKILRETVAFKKMLSWY